MFYQTDPDLGKPPKELLAKCQQLLITDSRLEELGVRPVDIKRWCQKNCASYLWMDEQDVSDVSVQWDYIYCFYIWDEKDVLLFTLKWK
jgi:hypothetical protein